MLSTGHIYQVLIESTLVWAGKWQKIAVQNQESETIGNLLQVEFLDKNEFLQYLPQP